jgi:hypothetical protein
VCIQHAGAEWHIDVSGGTFSEITHQPTRADGFTAHAGPRHGSGGSWMLMRPVVLSKISTFTLHGGGI